VRTVHGLVEKLAAHALDGLDDTNGHVAIGPIVWDPTEQHGRHWYFVTCTPGIDQPLRIVRFKGVLDRALIERCRFALCLTFAWRRPPLVIHDFDDELHLARFCAAIFPCEKSHRLLADIEAERKAAGPAAEEA
jgi:hypothetical protein